MADQGHIPKLESAPLRAEILPASTELAPPKPGVLGRRITELDGIRGLAIVMVLLFHYVPDTQKGSFLYYAFLPTRLMWSGVDLFFVLSGFLIGGILIDHRGWGGYFKTFYMRRIHRIFPLYYAMVISCAVGRVLFPNFSPVQNPMPMWPFFLFAQNIAAWWFLQYGPGWLGVTWSLAVEEQFYMVLPFIVRVLSQRALLRFAIGCVVGAPLLRLALVLAGYSEVQIHPLLVTRADALAWGVLAAIIVRSSSMTAWVRRNANLAYAVLITALVSAGSVSKWVPWKPRTVIGYSLYGLAYFLLVLLVLLKPVPSLRNALDWRWLRWFGQVSYCLYMIHEPVRASLALSPLPLVSGINNWANSFAALLVSVVIAQASWVFFEKKLIRRAHVRYKYEPPPGVPQSGLEPRLSPSPRT